MNGEQIAAFLQKHWNWATLIVGAVLLIGAVMNWKDGEMIPAALRVCEE